LLSIERGRIAPAAPRSATHTAPAAKPAASNIVGGFDFSKPYEPSPASGNAAGAEKTKTAAIRSPMRRQTAALLGGHAKKS